MLACPMTLSLEGVVFGAGSLVCLALGGDELIHEMGTGGLSARSHKSRGLSVPRRLIRRQRTLVAYQIF